MNSTLSKTFIFITGAAIGSGVTWYILKTKYEKLVQEEIDSVKEAFSNYKPERVEEDETDDKSELIPCEKEDNWLDEYKNCIKSNQYNYEPADDGPYVIRPDEFGDTDGYETSSLIYYDDKVLADDDDHVIEDVEGYVGEDSLNHFGEFEEDSVYVRNKYLKTDFEILLSAKKYYGEVVPADSKPDLEEGE